MPETLFPTPLDPLPARPTGPRGVVDRGLFRGPQSVDTLETYYASQGVPSFRPSGRQPLPGGFRSPSFGPGSPAPGEIDSSPLGRLAVESNSVLALLRFVGNSIETASTRRDLDFNSASFTEKVSSRVWLSDEEKEYLSVSHSQEEYVDRLSRVYGERRYYEGLKDVGGMGVVVGLAAGILDPVNFIPIAGPGVKVAQAVRLGRAARIASGASRGAVLRAAGRDIVAGAARAGGENVLIEAGLQAVVQSDRVTPSGAEAAFNIAGAGLFGAALGGGIRGLGYVHGAHPGGGEAVSRIFGGAADRARGLVGEALPELRPKTFDGQTILGATDEALAGRPLGLRALVARGFTRLLLDSVSELDDFTVAIPDRSAAGGFRMIGLLRRTDLKKGGGDPVRISGESGRPRIVVGLEAARESFETQDAFYRASMAGYEDAPFDSFDDWLDYLVVREAVRAAARTKKGATLILRESGGTGSDATEEVISSVARSRLAEARESIAGTNTPPGASIFHSTSGASPAPAPNSIPASSQGGAVAAMETHLILRGYPREVAKKAIRAWARVSPVIRVATSDVPFAREFFGALQPSPVYQRGQGLSTPAKVAVERRMAEVTLLEADTGRALAALNKTRQRPERWRHDELTRRVFAALNLKDVDEVSDELTPVVEGYAKRARQIMDEVADDLESMGIAKREALNEGESFLTRVYNLREVNTPAFLKMLQDALDMDDEAARAIQKTILGKLDQTPDLFRSARGAKRSRTLGEIPFEQIRPFLQQDGMSVFRMATRRFVGEIEFRRSAFAMVSRRLPNFDPADLLTEEGDLNMDLVRRLLAHSDAGASKASEAGRKFMLDHGHVAADVNELRESYPELFNSPEFANLDSGPSSLDGLVSPNARGRDGEADALAKILNMAADDVRGREGVPTDPDSWLKTRLPNLIRDLSHMAFGGGIGIASLADLPLIVGRMGLSRTLRAGFVPLITQASSLKLSARQAHVAGLAMEDVRSTWARLIRNESAHLETRSWIESASAKGASWMNTLSGLSYVANMHQMASARVTMDFLGEMVETVRASGVDGIVPRDRKRLAMMGVSRRRLQALSDYSAADGALQTHNGVRVFDGDSMSPAGRDLLSDILISSEYQTRSLPGRMEMPVNSSDPWKSLMWMYRSWIVGNTNRILVSGLSTADKAWAMGIVSGLGIGAIIFSLKVAAGLVKEPDSIDGWAAGAVDQSGVLGALSEGNNLVNRASGGAVGFGSQRYFAANTTIGAVLGPGWGLTRPLTGAGEDLLKAQRPDAADAHRVRQSLPYNQLFYLKWLIDMIDPGVSSNDSQQPIEPDSVRR